MPKKVEQRHKEEGQSDPGIPPTLNTIHLTDLIFGTSNELPLNFQLSVNTWCLTGFHGNHNS